VQIPEEARELDMELKQIRKQKNEVVRSQDFERVVVDYGLITLKPFSCYWNKFIVMI
jgi:hypothetical protein